MKTNLLLLIFAVSLILQFQKAQSKDEDQTHHFKIVGNTHLQTPKGEKVVEYDPESPDHLFISEYDNAEKITLKGQFLFTGKSFRLSSDNLKYIQKKELMMDGPLTFFRNGIMEKTINYRKEEIISQIDYYPNGQPKSQVPGEVELRGEYKMWHPNGQLSFTGQYKENLKEGDFELFDESGKSLKKGTYEKGKLISGEHVLMAITYKNPEVAAKYEKGEEAFNQYLTTKAAGLGSSKIVYSDKDFYLNLIFDEKGKLTDIFNNTYSAEAEKESIKSILKDCPAFIPAMVENIPVKSSQLFTFRISAKGVQLTSEEKVYTSVDESPEFRGGPIALRNYIASQIKYPAKAIQSGIQGKVFVAIVINKDGKVSDANVVRGVHPLLDAEALRVVNNMPKWKPGMMHGKPVRVGYTVPISFTLTAPVMPEKALE